MLKQWQFRLLTALALATGALVTTNIVMFTSNRDAQNEFTSRAQYIQQSQQIEPVYQGIVRGLAEISVKTNDLQIGQLLTAQGITFSVNPVSQGEVKGKAK